MTFVIYSGRFFLLHFKKLQDQTKGLGLHPNGCSLLIASTSRSQILQWLKAMAITLLRNSVRLRHICLAKSSSAPPPRRHRKRWLSVALNPYRVIKTPSSMAPGSGSCQGKKDRKKVAGKKVECVRF
jgi:hypothetical protein